MKILLVTLFFFSNIAIAKCPSEVKKDLTSLVDSQLEQQFTHMFHWSYGARIPGGLKLYSCDATPLKLTREVAKSSMRRAPIDAYLVSASFKGGDGLYRSVIAELKYIDKKASIKIVQDTGLHQAECGSPSLEFQLGPLLKIGKGCFQLVEMHRDFFGCAGVVKSESVYLQFLDNYNYENLLSLEVQRLEGNSKKPSTYSLENVLDYKKCEISRDYRKHCFEYKSACAKLSFKRDKTIQPSTGFIQPVGAFNGLEVSSVK